MLLGRYSSDPNSASLKDAIVHLEEATSCNKGSFIALVTSCVHLLVEDSHTWYLLGRARMLATLYAESFTAFQNVRWISPISPPCLHSKAIQQNSKCATYWCALGVLYFTLGQYHDALDAYGRAVSLDPQLVEVSFLPFIS